MTDVTRASGLFPPDALTEVEATLDRFLTGAAAPERMTDGTWNQTSGVPGFAGQRAFYSRLGFIREARIRDFYEPGDDKIVYWKNILAAP